MNRVNAMMRFCFPSFLLLWLCLCPGVKLVAGETTPAAPAAAAGNQEAIDLFDGKTLGKWKPVEFFEAGKVDVENGVMRVAAGSLLSGVVWTGKLPATNHYSIELEARKTAGEDFLLGLTLPVGERHCTWICGGWGGRLVGISSVDHLDASENELGVLKEFEKGKWYRFKIQVEPGRLQCWIDGKRMIDLDLDDRLIGMRAGDIESCIPLGISTYQTAAEYRQIVWKNLAK